MTSYNEIGFSPKIWGMSIFTPQWNGVGGAKNADPLEMCSLGPNKAISIIKLLWARKLHGFTQYTSLSGIISISQYKIITAGALGIVEGLLQYFFSFF